VRPPFRAGRTKPAVEGEPIAPLKSGISDERIGGAPIGSRRPILTVRHTHAIVEAMFAICNDFEAYGYRRVGAALRQQGLVVNHKKIRRLMCKHGLQPRIRRRFVTTTDSDHDGPIFPPSRASQRPDRPYHRRPAWPRWRLTADRLRSCASSRSTSRRPLQ
jgi:transposase InsO family protein